ncbi:S-layer homology domain-containing protein [Saccharibacillus deserti]|uniref:S-layer homology domain-containing protein n=1 Tax=Saccharibacillus deserti TaxID=1634444 RepID=UPI0015545F44|nr:S-layer homology domain-containing protein [Saccharibacillus deserti]
MTIKKMGLRIASTGLAALLLSSGVLTNAGTVSAASPASDTKGHWAESRIVQWLELGWIRGYSDGTFRPSITETSRPLRPN